ncbi:MAG: GNAT family N-acetyltransferase [Bacteroidota bacterium]
MNHFATKRFHIRPLQTADAAAVFAYRSDAEVVRYQMWRPEEERDVLRFIRDLRGLAPGMPGIWYQFGIIEFQSGLLVGDCGVHVPINSPDSVELGLTLCRSHQGLGYATEILQELIRYSFLTLHVHHIIARTHPDNHRSVALIKRCQFSALPLLTTKEELVYELRHTAWKQSLDDNPSDSSDSRKRGR